MAVEDVAQAVLHLLMGLRCDSAACCCLLSAVCCLLSAAAAAAAAGSNGKSSASSLLTPAGGGFGPAADSLSLLVQMKVSKESTYRALQW